MCVCPCRHLRVTRSEPRSSRGAGVPAWGRCSAEMRQPQTGLAPLGSLRWRLRERSLRGHNRTVKHSKRLLAVTQHCSRVTQLSTTQQLTEKRGIEELTNTCPVFISTLVVHTNPHCNTVLSSRINQRGVIWD